MSQHVQQALGRRDIAILADRGYDDSTSFKAVHEAGVTAIVPKIRTSANRSKGLFTDDIEASNRRVSFWYNKAMRWYSPIHVETEVSLHILAYNLKRMMNIMGVDGFISALKT